MEKQIIKTTARAAMINHCQELRVNKLMAESSKQENTVAIIEMQLMHGKLFLKPLLTK